MGCGNKNMIVFYWEMILIFLLSMCNSTRFNICTPKNMVSVKPFSREKQRMIISEPLKASSSPVNSDTEVDGAGRIAIVTKQVTDAEAKLKKHK